jgi:hypothetical protein
MHGLPGFRFVMDDELVPKQVEVYPVVAAATLFTAQNFAVKPSALLQVMHWNGDMERGNILHD